MMRHKKNRSSDRSVRVADQLQKDLAEIIPRELRDPRLGFVTLSDVELTPDYAYATVFFTVLNGDPVESEQALNDSAGYLRNLIFKKMRIHTVPSLRFKYDNSVARGSEMSKLIDDALKESPASKKQSEQ